MKREDLNLRVNERSEDTYVGHVDFPLCFQEKDRLFTLKLYISGFDL